MPLDGRDRLAELGDQALMRDGVGVLVAVLDRVVQQAGQHGLDRRAVRGQDAGHFQHVVHIGLARRALALVGGVDAGREIRGAKNKGRHIVLRRHAVGYS
jgi:hypothetical protein